MVRGRGYARSLEDIENIVAHGQRERHARPRQGRRAGRRSAPTCAAASPTWTAQGDAVAGIVVMRQGENALDVIDRVKAKLKEIEPGLPAGRQDRPHLRPLGADPALHRQPGSTRSLEVMITVVLVILLFLWHIPSAIIPIITIPVAVLLSFIPFRLMGITRQHHVARRHRHRHRRAGGRRHRGGGADPQEARALGAGRAARATTTT